MNSLVQGLMVKTHSFSELAYMYFALGFTIEKAVYFKMLCASFL
jgi:hypothetical protein